MLHQARCYVHWAIWLKQMMEPRASDRASGESRGEGDRFDEVPDFSGSPFAPDFVLDEAWKQLERAFYEEQLASGEEGEE